MKKSIVFILMLALLLPPLNFSVAETEEPFGYYSSIYLRPDYEKFNDPEYLYVRIMADPDGKPANSASAVIDFPTDMVQVVDFHYYDDFCLYFLDQMIDNENGSIKISCGGPIAATSTVAIAELTFLKKSSGNAKFDLSGSSLHAHDGYGTDFLGFSGVHYIYLEK
jgi:hypothetical protein